MALQKRLTEGFDNGVTNFINIFPAGILLFRF